MNINELMNISDVRESATVFPHHFQLTFHLESVCESRETWASYVPIMVLLGFSVLELFPMYATHVRQTEGRQHHCLMPPPRGRGHSDDDDGNRSSIAPYYRNYGGAVGSVADHPACNKLSFGMIAVMTESKCR